MSIQEHIDVKVEQARVPSALREWDQHRRGSTRVITAAVLLTDLTLMLLTTLVAVVGRHSLTIFPEAADVSSAGTGMAVWLVPLWLAVFAAWGLYRPKNMGAGSLEYQSVVTAPGITGGAAAALLSSAPAFRRQPKGVRGRSGDPSTASAGRCAPAPACSPTSIAPGSARCSPTTPRRRRGHLGCLPVDRRCPPAPRPGGG